MDMDELLEHVLALPEPWVIVGAELDKARMKVEVRVVHEGSRAPCPECSADSPRHDSQERKWRHLDLCDHQTWIVCEVPRVKCQEHGVRKMNVPWADGWSRFTARFECVIIDWLLEASMSAVARNFGLSWDQVYGIQQRAVVRGLARRARINPTRIGVDETSFQKRHEYVTIVCDLEGGKVLHVADGRSKSSLDSFFEGLDQEQLCSIEVVAMDMHAPFIYSAARFVPNLADKLCFDRFHVAQLFSRAIDNTRRSENKRLMAEGDSSLKGTRYTWLRSQRELPRRLRKQLADLLQSTTQISKVWAIKEAASKLWHYKTRAWARKAWLQLCKAALKFDIPALTKTVDTVLNHMLGIVNAIVLRATNARSESINSQVQSLKRRANGYRNRARFRDAIMFHLGGLDLYPNQLLHSKP
jgi:transposase